MCCVGAVSQGGWALPHLAPSWHLALAWPGTQSHEKCSRWAAQPPCNITQVTLHLSCPSDHSSTVCQTGCVPHPDHCTKPSLEGQQIEQQFLLFKLTSNIFVSREIYGTPVRKTE